MATLEGFGFARPEMFGDLQSFLNALTHDPGWGHWFSGHFSQGIALKDAELLLLDGFGSAGVDDMTLTETVTVHTEALAV